MEKNIRWQIPFVSLQGIHYRVDIYDEQDGSWSGVTELTAGPTPFVTNEDSSDDFFHPIRTQTGTLQVCTLKPDGNYITLDDLLPVNNIARPVRLINNDTTPNTIEWQGFLSCEAYSQDYTGIPQILDLPLISVLEAMDSVQADTNRLTGIKTVSSTITAILETFIDKAGELYFTEYYIPSVSCGSNILQKYIDNIVLFDKKEYNNENSTTYIIDGMSLKDCLSRIATYMGWCIRENNISLYFIAANETNGYNRHYRTTMVDHQGHIIVRWLVGLTEIPVITNNMESLNWRGTGHKRSIIQGAKSVEVVASLKKYELNLNLPDCPVGDLTEIYRQLWKYSGNGDWLYLLANRNTAAYSNISYANYTVQLRYAFFHFENYGTTNLANVLSHMAVGPQSSARATIQGGAEDMYSWYAGAFLCRYDWEETGTAAAHNVSDALYCVFFPHSLNYSNESQYTQTDFDPYQVGAIFSIDNVINYRCNSGYIKIDANADTVFMWPSQDYTGAELIHSSEKTNQWYICIELQIGNNWWNGSGWQNTRCQFYALMTKNGFKSNWNQSMSITETDGLLIPVNYDMHGIVTFKIWPMASPTSYSETNSSVLEMIFSSIEVSHVLPTLSKSSDRSENHYFRLLGTNFRDEISVGTDLASMLNNIPSPSLIMDDTETFMKELNYGSSQSPDMRRPEVDLLNRLAAYYGAARQRLELEVAHPTFAPLPLLKLNGINDGKLYLPLSESRDWQTDECKLTCFECPQQPAES